MKVIIITGSAGLIGSEAAEYFAKSGYTIAGVDNDMRKTFFGAEASTQWRREQLEERLNGRYIHHALDIRDKVPMQRLFEQYGSDIVAVIHAAAQPAHDWAVKDPYTDFEVNANGTLNMLDVTRRKAPQAAFIHVSTAKVYGDAPNRLPLEEFDTRYDLHVGNLYYNGIHETFPIDNSMHSLYGASKTAADILAQEYGRYFDMNVVSVRGNCMTGSLHSGTMLHGFLSYLMKCALTGQEYVVLGYKGKQVRDNIHSYDFITAFDHLLQKKHRGGVYNLGGGRASNCSILEAIAMCESITGKKMNYRIDPQARKGDHIWYITDNSKFMATFPDWKLTKSIPAILTEIAQNTERWLTQ